MVKFFNRTGDVVDVLPAEESVSFIGTVYAAPGAGISFSPSYQDHPLEGFKLKKNEQGVSETRIPTCHPLLAIQHRH